MKNEPREIALTYISACASKDLDTVASILAPDIQFVGPGSSLTGAEPYLAVIRRLGPVWERSDVKRVFADGPEVCVIYDFVTNTSAGAVPIVEWLRIEGGKIASVTLYFDRVTFKPASEELARRASR
jgi:ketosteroid isomerase-like protein